LTRNHCNSTSPQRRAFKPPANKQQAPLTPEQAARIIVTAATLTDHAESGTFIDENGVVPW